MLKEKVLKTETNEKEVVATSVTRLQALDTLRESE